MREPNGGSGSKQGEVAQPRGNRLAVGKLELQREQLSFERRTQKCAFTQLAQIKEAEDLGVLDGVTTNPSLMAKEGITGTANILKHYVDICNIVTGDVSAEVISTDYKGIIEEGEKLASLHKQIVVKVPMIKDGVKALKYFSNKGIKTNCTLVFSAGQALLAAKAGATYVSPFLGRLDDINQDGIELIEQIVYIMG